MTFRTITQHQELQYTMARKSALTMIGQFKSQHKSFIVVAAWSATEQSFCS